MQTKCTPSVEQELRRQGFTEGPPASVPPSSVEIDRRCYRDQRCERCRRRGQRVSPFHRGRSEYRLVLTCKACGHQSEG